MVGEDGAVTEQERGGASAHQPAKVAPVVQLMGCDKNTAVMAPEWEEEEEERKEKKRRRKAGQEADPVLLAVDQSGLSAAVLEVTECGGRDVFGCAGG